MQKMDFLIIAILVGMSGMFSGLTIGLMGLTKTELKRYSDLGDNKATKVFNLVSNQYLLLVTLLMGNTAVNSILSIFLSEVSGGGFVGATLATFLILIFGEILPAVLLSKHAILVGSLSAPLIKIITIIFSPISYPIAMVLNRIFGETDYIFHSRRELAHVINEHACSKQSDIDNQDAEIINGVLLLNDKIVGDHMTVMPYTLSGKIKVNRDILIDIRNSGHTRIPITDGNMVIGVLNAKRLLGVELDSSLTLKDYMNNDFIYVQAESKLDDILYEMKSKHIHIAFVKSYDSIVGLITMEDIIEEILQVEILDEFDKQ